VIREIAGRRERKLCWESNAAVSAMVMLAVRAHVSAAAEQLIAVVELTLVFARVH